MIQFRKILQPTRLGCFLPPLCDNEKERSNALSKTLLKKDDVFKETENPMFQMSTEKHLPMIRFAMFKILFQRLTSNDVHI